MMNKEKLEKYWKDIKIFINEDGEEVYLKKDRIDWFVIHPWFDRVSGKINLKNMIAGGSWVKLIIAIGMVTILIFGMIEFVTVLNTANECLAKLPDYALNILN